MKSCPACRAGFVSAGWACPACSFEPQRIGDFAALAPELAHGGAGFPPEAFGKLARLESRNFWFRARNKLIVWALKRHFPELKRYLEIGCGTGYVLAGVAAAYPEAKLVGSEVFSVGLPHAAARVGQAELLQLDARHIPYEDEFDAIGAYDVLEHIEEDERVLAAMYRALRPGGGIALTVPQHRWLWSSADDAAHHVRRYAADELRHKAVRAGFEVRLETSFVSLLLPAMFLSRLAQRKGRTDQVSTSELDLAAPLNGLFGGAMTLERWLIRAGVRFPCGGSRLLIATKPR